MGAREEVQEILDTRITQLESMIKRFEEFGNNGDPERLVQHAINHAVLTDFRALKIALDLTVDWGKDK